MVSRGGPIEQSREGAPSGAPKGSSRPDLNLDLNDGKAAAATSSTAGASSGDFHIYRHSRARELARLERLEKERQKEIKDVEFERNRAEKRKTEERKTESRARKRRRKKERATEKRNANKAKLTNNAAPDIKRAGSVGDEKEANLREAPEALENSEKERSE